MKIKVTKDDIRNGMVGSALYCPVALAIRRAMPEATDVGVGFTIAGFVIGDEEINADLPDEAVQFIRSFDEGDPVEPFEFYWRFRND